MTELTLDENHTYLLDGKPVDGLTSTIKEAGLIRNSDKKYMKNGTAIHKITELWDLGIIDQYEIDPNGLPYLESWKRFRKDQNYTPVEIEYKIFNPELLVASTVDRIPLLDLKSGSAEPWHILQIAFQWETIRSFYPDKYSWMPSDVYLDPDGGPPKVKTYTTIELREAYKVYCSMLHFLRWRREKYGSTT
jgi:hypothetical protein